MERDDYATYVAYYYILQFIQSIAVRHVSSPKSLHSTHSPRKTLLVPDEPDLEKNPLKITYDSALIELQFDPTCDLCSSPWSQIQSILTFFLPYEKHVALYENGVK